MKRFRPLTARRCGVALLASGALLAAPALAQADTIAPIDFEPPAYAPGDINGQNGWMKTGPYDSAVASVAPFGAPATAYGFETQALRMSNAVASGSFGDQTFSPGLASPAGESTVNRQFEASFKIGTTTAAFQPDLRLSVSPDDGLGSRMSLLRLEDRADGVHVLFFDVTNAGPVGTTSAFNEHDIATLDRTRAHRITFSLHLKPGPANDVARIYVDGRLKRIGNRCATGGTWEDYYRFDPEQTPSGNHVPTTSKLLFHVRGASNPAGLGQGFLVDDVSLRSARRPSHKNECKDDPGKPGKGKDKGKGKGKGKGKHDGRGTHGKGKGKHRGDGKGSSSSAGKAAVTPKHQAALRTRLHAPGRIERGDSLRAKVTCINLAGTRAVGTTVSVKIPKGLILSHRTKGVTVKGGYASWNVAALGPKRTVTRTLKLVATSAGERTIVASSDADNARRAGSKRVVRVMGPSHSRS